MTKEKIEQARAMFLKNPYWKEIYESLSPVTKRRYDLTFLYSVVDKVGVDSHVVAQESHEYEEKMPFEDFTDLLRYSTNGYELEKIKRLMLAAQKRDEE